MSPMPIGETLFIDHTLRTVFEHADGRQFVVDGNGELVYGVWRLIDEPAIALRGRSSAVSPLPSLRLREGTSPLHSSRLAAEVVPA